LWRVNADTAVPLTRATGSLAITLNLLSVPNTKREKRVHKYRSTRGEQETASPEEEEEELGV